MQTNNAKYSRRLRMYKEGFLSVCIYVNIMENGDKYYDTVFFRKIGKGKNAKFKRGTSLKPTDLPNLLSLTQAAIDFITAEKLVETS